LSKLRIAVYAISKNEEAFVEQFIKSAQKADLVLIADTGSTDKTVELARELGATVHSICINPWRFDKARDAALALVPKDIDVCISIDLDEVLEEGWREEIERVWQSSTTHLRYKYDWGQGVIFFAEKIHSRHGYHWHHPCHEYIRADPRIEEVWANTDKLLVTHHPDPTKSRGQYLELLKVGVTEDPYCPRNAFYYARELTFYYHWEEAIVALNKYLDMPNATWNPDRAYAMRLIGKGYNALGKHTEALYWHRLACEKTPDSREPWCALSLYCYEQSNWSECYYAADKALNITFREQLYTSDPTAWGFQPHDLAAIAAWNLGLTDKALSHGLNALELAPDDTRLQNNVRLMRCGS
jgi:glycosyltransferase involved in cell wall biosynthesis